MKKIGKKDIVNYFERLKEIKKLESECKILKPKLNQVNYLKKLSIKYQLKRSILNMHIAFTDLEEEEKELLYQKYYHKVSLRKLAQKLNVSQRTVERRIKTIIDMLNEC